MVARAARIANEFSLKRGAMDERPAQRVKHRFMYLVRHQDSGAASLTEKKRLNLWSAFNAYSERPTFASDPYEACVTDARRFGGKAPAVQD